MTHADAGRLFLQAVGCDIPFKVVGMATWQAGRALVAERYGEGGCCWAATPSICSRRPAAWATTPRSKMPSTSAGNLPPWCMVRRRRNCWTATKSNGGRWRCAIPGLPQALPIRSAFMCRHRRSKTIARRVRPRAAAPAPISRNTAAPNLPFPASPSARATTVRRLFLMMAHRRRVMSRPSMCRPANRAAVRRTAGRPTAGRCSTVSVSTGRC